MIAAIVTLWRAARAALTGDDPCPGAVLPHAIDTPDPYGPGGLWPTGALGIQKMQGGLPAKTQRAWRAIAAAFPGLMLGSWGDRSHMARASCHNSARAIDIMTADPGLHSRIVGYLLEHRTELDVTLIISRRKKWSAATGWKPAPYKGTSPHTDHVHASIGCAG